MERRRFSRVVLHQAIALSFDREKYIDAQCIDLSEGGIRCRSVGPVEPLTRIYLMVGIPDGDKIREIRTEGSVVWVERKDQMFEFGVAFDPLPAGDAAALRSFIATL